MAAYASSCYGNLLTMFYSYIPLVSSYASSIYLYDIL